MDKYLEESVKPDVLTLLDLKINSPEIGEGKRFDKINEYIDNSIDTVEELIKSLPTAHGNGWDELNRVFLSLL